MGAALNDILAIPGNAPVYHRLNQLLAEGSAIAFLGAGTSAPLYPLWGELIGKLAHEPILRGLAADADEQYWLRSAASKPLQVASQIRAKLGDALYRTFLHETFQDQANPTPSQIALMRANFKAYITTNYDGGIVEARRRLLPDRATDFTIWDQSDPINRWASLDVFDDTQCPVLFAHGHYAKPESIVLDQESYRIAYHHTPYRRFFETLWFQQHLVFAGFSFNDITLGQIADEVLWQTARQGGGAPRHIAILGLSQTYSKQMREEYLDGYHAQVLFYPAENRDHSALQILLDSLASRPVTVVETPKPKPAGEGPSRFVHETTEDKMFTGRGEALARLDRWASDPGVRLIAMTAVGGLGKTALAGHWLRRHVASEARFFWSFYVERDTRKLFEALEAFEAEAGSCRVVVVLDGLEVIQEIPGTVAYGELLSVELAEFLHAQCRSAGTRLIVLTSRFPFPDLTSYLGGSLRSLPLPSLDPAEGSRLLHDLGVDLPGEDREEIARNLSGHPLALRIFARTSRDGPARLVSKAKLAADDPLEDKMRRLLAFYEACLPDGQKRALGLLSLFRIPVGESALAPLWQRADSLRDALRELHLEGLLTADSGGDGKPHYACHPILRDRFRGQFVAEPEFARQAAGLIAGPPDAQKNLSREAVQIVAGAIELLLDAGEVKPADDLYRSRMGNGNIFKWLPAPHWGMQVARGFVRDATRRQAILRTIGGPRLTWYLNEAGLFANYAGEPETALEFYRLAISLDREFGDQEGLCIDLQNLGETEISLGRLAQAASHFSEALVSAPKQQKRNALTYAGYTAILRGDADGGNSQFAEASELEDHMSTGGIHGLRGIQSAERYIRIGSGLDMRWLTENNRRICDRNHWREDVARCDWILGWLDTLAGDWVNADARLSQAQDTFSAGHMIYELARVFVTKGALHIGQGRWDDALGPCQRALQLAAPRNYRLIQADALNLRARIKLERANPDPAGARDDAEAALQLAGYCDYHWAGIEAQGLLDRADAEVSRTGSPSPRRY